MSDQKKPQNKKPKPNGARKVTLQRLNYTIIIFQASVKSIQNSINGYIVCYVFIDIYGLKIT